MDRLRRSLRESFRRRKDHVPECSKPHQWQADEAAVRAGTCSFSVKYLGCVEVFESRGMQVCEEALKVLRNSRRRPIRGTLYVTGDGLRVVDDETKGLIVDQTIEKVSFCAPDRNHERGFSYICRDGTTRRWMCHGFLAIRDSGERLSHAVGCAFAVCLERKQKRDKETVMINFDPKTSTFTRTGSFRQSSLTERMQDPQECKPADPPPVKQVHNPYAIERPHATQVMLQRQGSFRGFMTLNQTSPFKRQLSLRLNDLPSNLERQRSMSLESSDLLSRSNGPSVTPIPESSPIVEKQDFISAMCQQVSQGLSFLSNSDDPFLIAAAHKEGQQPQPDSPSVQIRQHQLVSSGANPWEGNRVPPSSRTSRAESWLAATTAGLTREHGAEDGSSIPTVTTAGGKTNQSFAGYSRETSPPPHPVPTQPVVPPRRSSPNFSHLRSQSLGSAEAFITKPAPASRAAREAAKTQSESSPPPAAGLWQNGGGVGRQFNDPFDAEWAALAGRNRTGTNPFAQNSVKAFEVQM